MCGIAGIYNYGDGHAVDPVLLAAMTDSLSHRGPDDSGLYVSGPVGLGQRRLSIVDLSAAGRNPMPNEDETLWITFNGEVYNVRERRAEFEARGHRFRSHTDTEMLLHLYEEKGAALVEDLRGMFAFALWDAPHRTLLVARDRLGIKPLYWRAQGGTFAFGSELKALLADPSCPREVDPSVVPAYLTLGYVPSPSSILSGVHKLEPGHLLVVSPKGPEVRRWWTPPINQTDALPVEEATRQLRALLEESVRLRFMSDVPFGGFLSGGIDSSIVCALMAKLMDRPVPTFTIGFAGAPEDERVHARAVAQHLHAEHHEYVVEPDALSILPRLAWHLDEPLADASALPTWMVSEMARRHVTVALSGDGGDETWGGYETYRLASAYAAFDALPGGARGLLGAIGRSGVVPDGLARRLGRASLDPVERHLALMALGSGDEVGDVLAPGIRAATPVDAIARARAEAARYARTDLRALGHLDLVTYMTDDVLAKVDRMSMAHALEVRVPLLDHVVVEFAARQPFDYKLKGGVSKWLLKRATRDLLPPSILARGKQGFGVPLERWFGGTFDAFVGEHLASARLERRGLFSPAGVRRLVARSTGAHPDPRAGRLVWAVLVFELWAERFLDRAPAPLLQEARP